MANAVTDDNFDKEVKQYNGIVVVDLWASWCGPCMLLSPIIDEVAEEFKDKVKVVKLNVDENPQTASEYGIMSIPTIMIFQNGEVKETLIGVRPKEVYQDTINKLLQKD